MLQLTVLVTEVVGPPKRKDGPPETTQNLHTMDINPQVWKIGRAHV